DAQHAVGERAQLAREVVLVEPFIRTGGDVADEYTRRELGDRRQLARRGAGEDLDLDAQGGEPLGDLADPDVHAAGVATAGLVERGRVHGQRRDPARQAHAWSSG